MGETISTLVFRPPAPTHLKSSRYFFLDIDPQTESYVSGCGATDHADIACASQSSDDSVEKHNHRIPAFFIKRKGASITLLFSHGNAEDLGMMYSRMKELARILQVNVMAYDYTGYGFSTGSPSEEMCYRNIEAAYSYLRDVRNIPSSQIVLYGRSLGSGPSCYLAAKTAREGQSVAALILHSPFLSVYRVVMDCGFNVVGDMFLNKSAAPHIGCPVLIVHGTKDEVVPFWHGQELLQTLPPQCRAQPFWAEGLGHNNIEVYLKQKYIEHVTGFLDSYVTARSIDAEEVEDKDIDPVSIPEEERAVQDPAAIAESKFFVNQLWVRYGKQIINEAVNSRKKNLEARKMQHEGESEHMIVPVFENENATLDTVSSPARSPVSSAVGGPVPGMNAFIIQNQNREITTKTCDLFLPDDEEENEEEREDENTNLINQGGKRDGPTFGSDGGVVERRKGSEVTAHAHRELSRKVTRTTGMKKQKRTLKKQTRKVAA